ncbi:transcription-repair coupling factor [Streptococcus ovuberis]|uniref:Transcription-repair-coupling factor n=1 Tax=Streptococcus ovuberis TaxID=1936207 RepID=A0A7X6MZN4_9STRE|nr:transcription-repair coupling factor [Streptococcus ovuberis]NKZ21370.1 transcription-repair coupling factor [Streptococcus ovuberis]
MILLDLLRENKQISQWLKNLNQTKRQLIMGLSDSSKALVMASAISDFDDKLLIVTPNQNEAEKLTSDLESILGTDKVFHFFADDAARAEFVISSAEKTISRLASLDFLRNQKDSGIVIASVQACRLLLPNPAVFDSSFIEVRIGDELHVDKFVNSLIQMGYRKEGRVLTPGEFSLRGDILDIFPLGVENPYRIEFFGDEIDSIRTFEINSQISKENFDAMLVSPASDMLFTSQDYQRSVKVLSRFYEQIDNLALKSYLEELLVAFKNESLHAEQRKFLNFFYEKEWTLLDYLPKQSLIFLDDFHKIQDSHAKFDLELAEYLTDNLQNNKGLSSQKYASSVYTQLRQYPSVTFFSPFQKGLGNIQFDALFQFNQHKMQEFFSQIPLLSDELRRFGKSGYTVLIQADSEQGLLSLQKTLQEYDVDLPLVSPEAIVKGEAQLVIGHLSAGFNFLDEKIALITSREIFHKKVKRKPRKSNLSNSERLKDYNELVSGDYVVHHIHGIGKFLGLETIEIGGVHRDYLTIQYQNSDRVSLPIEQIELLSKYVASDGKEPKISKLNDGRFQKTKTKVQKQVEDIADDLIRLYAERSQLEGHAFAEDDEHQVEFDQAFAYAETDDQLRSIAEVKKDMEAKTPMDRLLVGDVGFGKTEVAMRAAFKAVNDNKQVAILVPTTVLAQQHYTNFLARFLDFPVNIDVLSRFRSKAEQAKTLEKLKKGQVDILIGTHRLLSDDVIFADLGLIVIDEEQRFGVKHKEKLKELKTKVDVLTLTATPIPRTLHMSMLGIRDLSVIETPPTNRYPVQTYVMEFTPAMIREAILREIDRGGQVFYLYNRVDTIEQKVSEIRELVPEARIGFVHGQMSEIQLENTLMAFIEGDYDVLVTTTIIETGVDIPNANTLFIENADYMGLSTLYQLRGRVGRSNRIAYAYFMYRPDKVLTEVAEKRLEAIKGFTELGSGFKIAMRDLSIRGAGNLLGASQSGFIDSVGFELYNQLLEEAIAQKQGKRLEKRRSNAEINLQIDAYLPSSYISDERQKIEIYKRIRQIDGREDYQNLQDELIDRFGDYPDVVAYLIEIGLLKSFLDQSFVEIAEKKANAVTITFELAANQLFLTQDYFEALSVTHLKARISEHQGKMQVIFDIRNQKDHAILEELLAFAEKLVEIKSRKQLD